MPTPHREDKLIGGQMMNYEAIPFGLVVGLGRRCPLGGVPGNDMRLHRVLQRGVECGMDVAHHGVGELMPHLGVLVDTPLRF